MVDNHPPLFVWLLRCPCLIGMVSLSATDYTNRICENMLPKQLIFCNMHQALKRATALLYRLQQKSGSLFTLLHRTTATYPGKFLWSPIKTERETWASKIIHSSFSSLGLHSKCFGSSLKFNNGLHNSVSFVYRGCASRLPMQRHRLRTATWQRGLGWIRSKGLRR